MKDLNVLETQQVSGAYHIGCIDVNVPKGYIPTYAYNAIETGLQTVFDQGATRQSLVNFSNYLDANGVSDTHINMYYRNLDFATTSII